jgi:hypothetical protein
MSKLILKKNLKFKIQNYIILLLLIIVFIYFVYKLNNNYIEKFFNDTNMKDMEKLDLYMSNRSITIFYNNPESKKYKDADNYIKNLTNEPETNSMQKTLALLIPSVIKKYIIYKKNEIINKIKSKKSNKYTKDNFINDIYILAVAKTSFFINIALYATDVKYNDLFINIKINNEIQNAIENKGIYEIIYFDSKTNSSNISYKENMPALNKDIPPVKYEKKGYDKNDIFDINNIKDNILYDIVILQSIFYKYYIICDDENIKNNENTKNYCENKELYEKEEFNLKVKFYYTDLNLLFKLLAKYYESRKKDNNSFCDDTTINNMKKYNVYDSFVLKRKFKENFCYFSIMHGLIKIIFNAFARRLQYNMFSSNEQKNLLTTYKKLNPNFITIINNTFGTTLNVT